MTSKDNESLKNVYDNVYGRKASEYMRDTKTEKEVKGYDFNNGLDYKKLLKSMRTTGFQAMHLSKGIEIMKEGLSWRGKNNEKPFVCLSFTSNSVSCGLREHIRFLVEHKLVDLMVTTCGAIEEDAMKSMMPMFTGDFRRDDKKLRVQEINRIGNLIIPNENYCQFEDFFVPIVNQMKDDQKNKKIYYTPSMIIDKIGENLNCKKSILYWSHKNKIPIFCPAITDGAVGDVLYFQDYKESGFIVDVAKDYTIMSNLIKSNLHRKRGALLLGGGIAKHHVLFPNSRYGGLDFTLYVNTSFESDGSDSGATPSGDKTDNKIAKDGKAIKVFSEFSLVMPFIMSEAFYPEYLKRKKENEKNK